MTVDARGENILELEGALPTTHAAARDLSVYPLSAALVADGRAMRELRAGLDALACQYGDGPEPDAKIALGRPHVIAVLKCLHSNLKKILARPADLSPPGETASEIFLEHPTMALLQNFIGTLEDLDNAKTDAVLERASVSRGASLKASEIRKRDEILALVDVQRGVDELPSRAAAEHKLEDMMRKKVGRKSVPSALALKEMRKTRRRQQRKAS